MVLGRLDDMVNGLTLMQPQQSLVHLQLLSLRLSRREQRLLSREPRRLPSQPDKSICQKLKLVRHQMSLSMPGLNGLTKTLQRPIGRNKILQRLIGSFNQLGAN